VGARGCVPDSLQRKDRKDREDRKKEKCDLPQIRNQMDTDERRKNFLSLICSGLSSVFIGLHLWRFSSSRSLHSSRPSRSSLNDPGEQPLAPTTRSGMVRKEVPIATSRLRQRQHSRMLSTIVRRGL